jgi:endoglucanase Acf2
MERSRNKDMAEQIMKLVQQLCVALVAGVVFTAGAQTVKVGEARYWLAPQSGEKVPPAAPHRTPELLKTAAQTNQWYSTLIFNAQPEVVFAQPLTVKVATTGFELALPSKEVVPTVRRDVEIHYPHRDPLVFLPTDFKLDAHKLAKASDWSIDVAMGAGSDVLVATVSHGSPYVYFKLNRGDIRVQMPATSARVQNAADPRVLVLNVKGKRYAVFGPQGVTWEAQGADAFVGRLPAGKGYFSAAAMPDAKPETLAQFTQHAYAFIQDTKVAWRYDQAQSRVETTFTATTQAMEGTNTTPLLGLYPHHWFRNASVADRLGPAFDTLRGSIRTLAASEFKTVQSYLGWVPFWPAVADQPDGPKLSDVMSKDVRDSRRMLRQGGNGPYWQGKGLMRVIKLMDVVEQQGDLKERDRLLELVKGRIEDWFSGKDSKTYFQYDEKLGTMVAHPEEYFSIEQMNDHHFHYGYWIRAAAEIALRDPAWASKERWGGMVDKLIADIAHTGRGEKAFPFLRNFDPYEAHSWASGVGLGEFGNNQESSSEAVNAWAGLILWGEVTGNKAVRDLGVYLYTSEVQAIDHYWFDVHKLVFPPEYKNVETSMVFGGKYAHNTWWTDEPRQIKGINLLPINTGSTYLGRYPDYVQKNLDALIPETALYKEFGKLPPNPPPTDIWQDIFSKYQALANPKKALAEWERWGSVELGETRTSTLHWMLSLNAMGLPDFSVTADTPLYSVFKRADGGTTHLAYNASNAAIDVKFSDGKTMKVMPRTLGMVR